MSNYHVACGLAGIYAGVLRNNDEWKDKSDVTNEAVASVAHFLLESGKGFKFSYHGKRYRLAVTEQEEG